MAPDADILVVDDNPMNLTVIKGLLKATRVFVTTASSGEECLEKIRYGNFDVVLLDHMMPGMDGIETMAHIREEHPDLPVYALTANSMAGGDEFYKSKGFNGYLSKPIDSTALEKAIMRHLPEDIMMKPSSEDAVAELTELPEDKQWLNDVEGISVKDGVKCSGGISTYINSVTDFYETIDVNADVIEKAYNENDIKMFTIKVHSLKTSARFVGASVLSSLAESLEEAGKKENISFIHENASNLLGEYRAFKDKFAKIAGEEHAADDEREPVPEDVLQDAYEALKEVIPQMDYDSVEMIIGQIKEYRLGDEDEKKFAELEKCLKKLDWDAMEKLLA